MEVVSFSQNDVTSHYATLIWETFQRMYACESTETGQLGNDYV